MSRPTLPELDESLYPQVWKQQRFDSAPSFLMALLKGDIDLEPIAFTKQLLANDTYQQWINFTVFGRYIQRSFAAFYQQSEDSFNMDIPALFRTELMRHTQFLPLDQILFVAGDIPKSARTDKLFTTTLNPVTAIKAKPKSASIIHYQPVINQIRVASKQVVGFAIRHNKRTSERTRNEVLILDFNDLRLVEEQEIHRSNTAVTTLLRFYELR